MMARLKSVLAALNPPSEPRLSLSVGCGDFAEAGLLAARLPGWLHIGLDRVVEVYRLDGDTRDCACLQADGRFLPFRTPFSLILVRHPDVDRWREDWARVLARLPDFLIEGGLLLLTTYSLAELDFARQIIPLPRLPLLSEQLAPVDLAGLDRFVWVGIKQAG